MRPNPRSKFVTLYKSVKAIFWSVVPWFFTQRTNATQTSKHDSMVCNWLFPWEIFNRIKVLGSTRVLDTVSYASYWLVDRLVHSNSKRSSRRRNWCFLTDMGPFAWPEAFTREFSYNKDAINRSKISNPPVIDARDAFGFSGTAGSSLNNRYP